MGKILKVHNKGDKKVEVTLELGSKEIQLLKGNLEEMHIFSENNLDVKSRIVQRGKRESTKYFLVPREFKLSQLLPEKVSCTRIETKVNYIYIFKAEKTPQPIKLHSQGSF